MDGGKIGRRIVVEKVLPIVRVRKNARTRGGIAGSGALGASWHKLDRADCEASGFPPVLIANPMDDDTFQRTKYTVMAPIVALTIQGERTVAQNVKERARLMMAQSTLASLRFLPHKQTVRRGQRQLRGVQRKREQTGGS